MWYTQWVIRNNQIEKDELKEKIKTLIDSNTYIAERNKELKKEELKQQQVELWKRTLQICTRLFHTSTSYKKLHAIETAKFKKEREEKQKEINSIQKEINEVFIEAIQELREQYPKLTQEDLFYCILQYLRLSTSTIKFCMRVESNQALTQRKYRIKKQISPQTFSIIFNESSPSEGVLWTFITRLLLVISKFINNWLSAIINPSIVISHQYHHLSIGLSLQKHKFIYHEKVNLSNYPILIH